MKLYCTRLAGRDNSRPVYRPSNLQAYKLTHFMDHNLGKIFAMSDYPHFWCTILTPMEGRSSHKRRWQSGMQKESFGDSAKMAERLVYSCRAWVHTGLMVYRCRVATTWLFLPLSHNKHQHGNQGNVGDGTKPWPFSCSHIVPRCKTPSLSWLSDIIRSVLTAWTGEMYSSTWPW